MPGRQHRGDVDGLPAPLVQFERRPDVFGLGVGVHATNVVDGIPAEDNVGSHAERGVEPVASGLDEPVENGLHVSGTARDDVVQVAVGLRGLHESDLVIDEEREGLDQELAFGHEVSVEDHEVLRRAHRERVIDVARLGAVRAQPAQVAHAQLRGKVTYVVRAAVIEHPGQVLALHRPHCGNSCPDHVDVLAVGGDEHVHGGRLVAQVQGPPLWSVRQAILGNGSGVHEARPRLVEVEFPGVARPGQNRPHGQQRLEDQDRLGQDDQRIWQPVSSTGRVQQERRVGEDADGGDQHQHHERRRVGVGRCRGSARADAGRRLMRGDPVHGFRWYHRFRWCGCAIAGMEGGHFSLFHYRIRVRDSQTGSRARFAGVC